MTAPILSTMFKTLGDAVASLRERVTDVRYGPILSTGKGIWLFDFDGYVYEMLELPDRVLTLTDADKVYAIRALLDGKAHRLYPNRKDTV